jgi:cytochrome b561
MSQKVIITGLIFVFVFLFGYWLSRSGRPYNALIFNIHKLIGLTLGVFLIVTVYRAHQVGPFSPEVIIAIAATVIIFINLVAAGGLLSIEDAGNFENISQSMSTAISVIHKVLPYFAVLSTAATLYLLLFRKA